MLEGVSALKTNNRHSLLAQIRSTRERCDDLSNSSNQSFQMSATIELIFSNARHNRSSKLCQTINLSGREKLLQTVKHIQSKYRLRTHHLCETKAKCRIDLWDLQMCSLADSPGKQFAHHSTLWKLHEDENTHGKSKSIGKEIMELM